MAIMIFDQGGAALYPVAIIIIDDTIHIADFGAVNMSANDAVNTPVRSFSCDNSFIFGDKLNRVFDLLFQMGRERPIRHMKSAAHSVEQLVGL